MSKLLCQCNYCKIYVEEPEVRGSGNPHARNVCPNLSCGKELNSKYSDYTAFLVSDGYYASVPKLKCVPNYLH